MSSPSSSLKKPEPDPNWAWPATVVVGELQSKSNRRQIGKVKMFSKKQGRMVIRPIVRKSDEALQYVDSFMLQVRRPPVPYLGWVSLSVVVYHKDRRPDLDIALLQDCVQKAQIIKNDRQVVEIHAWHRVSKKRPRVVFSLKAVAPPQVEA